MMTMMMTKTFLLLGACIVAMTTSISADSDMDERMNALQTKVDNIETRIRKADIKSAFSATNPRTLNVYTHQSAVRFDHLTLNHGLAGYDTKTGVYTAPVDGLYQFNVRVTVNCANCNYVGYLMVNGERLAGVAARDKNYYDGGTSTAIADLKKGDRVFLKTATVESNMKIHYEGPLAIREGKPLGIYHHTFSAFSGVLLEAF